ncbi:MAG: hypothetical protein BWZ02_02878 [Lentisphaerae bacterium ADurb.BinA184]|nr:MAG: hypothetical protein BWZ02_02878 [Lentisphaerae bacterium ADurb.BinA184]
MAAAVGADAAQVLALHVARRVVLGEVEDELFQARILAEVMESGAAGGNRVGEHGFEADIAVVGALAQPLAGGADLVRQPLVQPAGRPFRPRRRGGMVGQRAGEHAQGQRVRAAHVGVAREVAALHVPALRVGHDVGEVGHLRPEERAVGGRQQAAVDEHVIERGGPDGAAHHVEAAAQGKAAAQLVNHGGDLLRLALLDGLGQQAKRPAHAGAAGQPLGQLGIPLGARPDGLDPGRIGEQARVRPLRVGRPLERQPL